jgi:LDH2 family malate/lactate/ureidoglycolate dehydrogenase
MFMMAIDVSKLQPVDEFKASTDRFVRALRAVEPAHGFEGVIVPGEPEAQLEAQRRERGIPIRDEVWQAVLDVADRLGVAFEGEVTSEAD